MLPAFLPAECVLVYAGSVNGERPLPPCPPSMLVAIAFHNSLRTRSLLSFIAVVLQIPTGFGLRWILDNQKWNRRKRGLIGLTVVAVPLATAWIWEIVSRHQ